MEKFNRIIKGVNSDNDLRYQPEDTMRESMNGTIMSVGNNRFAWRPIGSTELLFELPEGEKSFGHCKIWNINTKLERYFILSFNEDTGLTRLLEIIHTEAMVLSIEERWSGLNNPLSLSTDHPIRSMIGFYEKEDIQRIYFTDFHNQPRVFNIGNGNVVTVNEKFANFYPSIEGLYGRFSFVAILPGGGLPAGNMFFCWQYYNNDGYYTDWSYLSNPVHITADEPLSDAYFQYQRMQGRAPDFNTGKSIEFKISGIDDDYESIRIAAFYSNDYNSAGPGEVFYDSPITGSEMNIVYLGNENVDTITIDDLTNHSIVLKKVKEMTLAQNMNVIAAVKEREELDFSNLLHGKNNQIRVTVAEESYEIPLDVTGSELTGTVNNEKGLFAAPHVSYDKANNILRAGVWYKVSGSVDLQWTDTDAGGHTELAGSRFKPNLPGIVTAGVFIPIIRRKLYKMNTSTPATPTNLTAHRLIGQIRLTWNDNSLKEDGYRIHYRLVGNPAWFLWQSLPADTTEGFFNHANSLLTWEFYVVAFNVEGDSAISNIVSSRVLPPLPIAPSNLVATGEPTKIVLTWNDNSDNEERFELWYKRKGLLYPWTILNKVILAPDIVTYDFIPAAPVDYEFRISACNETGCSAFSNTAEGKVTPEAPDIAPASVSVYQESNCGPMIVSWSAVPRATSYILERFTTSGWNQILNNHENTYYYDSYFQGTNNLFAMYRVKARNVTGDGPYSASAEETSVCTLSGPDGGGGGGPTYPPHLV